MSIEREETGMARGIAAPSAPAPAGRQDGPAEPSDREVVLALTDVLVRTCRRLGEAGHPQDAGRLAARAWAVLRRTHPRAAEHVNGAMHHLARLEESPARDPSNPPRTRSGRSSGPVRR